MNQKLEISDDPEIVLAVGFIEKHRKLIIAVIVLIALSIVGKSWYDSNKLESQKAAADKLFTLKNSFAKGEYEVVIKDGIKGLDNYSGTNQAAEMLMLVAQSYALSNKADDAIKLLEDNGGKFSGSSINVYGVNNMLGALYLDKATLKKDASSAQKAVDYFDKAVKAESGALSMQASFKMAEALIASGSNDKAKVVLTELEANEELGYALKEQVKTLLETL